MDRLLARSAGPKTPLGGWSATWLPGNLEYRFAGCRIRLRSAARTRNGEKSGCRAYKSGLCVMHHQAVERRKAAWVPCLWYLWILLSADATVSIAKSLLVPARRVALTPASSQLAGSRTKTLNRLCCSFNWLAVFLVACSDNDSAVGPLRV